MTVVKEFHNAFGLVAADYPRTQPDDLIRLRIRLIQEEFQETRTELLSLITAQNPRQRVAALQRLLKELADLRYVLEGTAVTFGLPINDAFTEVHRSNMSKLGLDGKPILREDGKVLKGPRYSEADMKRFVPDIIDIEGDIIHD